jgi:small nuclear ribonucleoprotein (snRNP)-like protein
LTLKKLNNLVGITLGDVILELENNHKIYTKLKISDQNFNLTYALADLLLIPKVATVNEPDWDVTLTFDTEENQILHLIKAKSALSEVDNMVISIDKNHDDELICKFSFGDEHGHNNQITYSMYGDINIQEMKLPFNSNLFKTILQANKDMTKGTMYLSSKGLMKLEFKTEDGIESNYYMVRKESTNF